MRPVNPPPREPVKLLWITSDGRASPPGSLVRALGAGALVDRAAMAPVLADLRAGVAVAAAYDVMGLALDAGDPLLVEGAGELLARLAGTRGVVVGARPAIERLPEVPEGWVAIAADASPIEQASLFRLIAMHVPTAAVEAIPRRSEAPGRGRRGAPRRTGSMSGRRGEETRQAGSRRDLELCGEVAQGLLRETDPQRACRHFLVRLQERLGVARMAIFLRPSVLPWDLLGGRMQEDEGRLFMAASLGIGERESSHLRLSLRGGLGRMVSSGARAVVQAELARCRDRALATVAAREFALLGMQAAVPLFDSQRCRGVLMLSYWVTGGRFDRHELLLLFQLAAQLATTLERFDLLAQASARHALLEGVMTGVDSGVVVVSDQMQVVLCNRAATRLLGLRDAGLVLGRDVALLSPPVARLAYAAARAPAELTGVAPIEDEIGGCPVVIRVMRFRPPLIGGGGDPMWLIAVIEDAAAEGERRRAVMGAERERFIRQLADRLSHELRNALVPVRTFLQLLPERFAEEEFRDSFSRVVTTELMRIEDLLDKLTLFTARAPERLGSVSLRRAVRAALAEEGAALRRRFGELPAEGGERLGILPSERREPIRVELDLTDEADEVEGSMPQLVVALRELIRNGVQAMPGGGLLQISCRRVEEAEQVLMRLEIRDTGPGFPSGEDPTVPFFTTRSVGPGLGLSLAKKLIEGIRGRLVLSSPQGGGARVRVELPARSVGLSV